MLRYINISWIRIIIIFTSSYQRIYVSQTHIHLHKLCLHGSTVPNLVATRVGNLKVVNLLPVG